MVMVKTQFLTDFEEYNVNSFYFNLSTWRTSKTKDFSLDAAIKLTHSNKFLLKSHGVDGKLHE